MDRHELERCILDESIDPQEKYRHLWEYYWPRLLAYMKSFSRIPSAEREDAVSDILLKAFGGLHKYNPVYSLSTWVYSIARNHALDLYRKTGGPALPVPVGEIDERIAGTGERADPADAIIEEDSAERCRQCIESLNEKDRRIVLLKYYEGLNAKEIAAVEGMTHGAVRQRLTAVKSRIKKMMGDDYEN